MIHRVTVSEGGGTAAQIASDDDYHAKAFCDCGWTEDHWHHADDYDNSRITAYDAAEEAGQQHIKEESE